jgi:hypothetical protein
MSSSPEPGFLPRLIGELDMLGGIRDAGQARRRPGFGLGALDVPLRQRWAAPTGFFRSFSARTRSRARRAGQKLVGVGGSLTALFSKWSAALPPRPGPRSLDRE